MAVLRFLGRILRAILIILGLTGVFYAILILETPSLAHMFAGNTEGTPGPIAQFFIAQVFPVQQSSQLMAGVVFLPFILYLIRRFWWSPNRSYFIRLVETGIVVMLFSTLWYGLLVMPLNGPPEVMIYTGYFMVITLSALPALDLYILGEFVWGIIDLIRERRSPDPKNS